MNYNDKSQYSYYDIEVLLDYMLIVINTPDDEWVEIENPTFGQLSFFMDFRNLVGFNNHSYDDTVMAILYYHHLALESQPEDPIDLVYAKQISDQIINQEKLDAAYNKTRLLYRTYDVSKYAKSDMGYAPLKSLKAFESAQGMAIEETPIPFDKSPWQYAQEIIDYLMKRLDEGVKYPQKLVTYAIKLMGLSDYEEDWIEGLELYIKELLRYYCRHDVMATKIYHHKLIDNKCVSSVEWVRQFVADELGAPLDSMWYKSANSLAIKLFEPELGQPDSVKYNRQDFFDFIDSWDNKWLQAEPVRTIKEVLIASAEFKDIGYEPLIEEFVDKFDLVRKGKTNKWYSEEYDMQVELKSDTFTITYDGFVFGLGGIHSHQGELIQKLVFDADVDSLHPSTMKAIRALGSATEKFAKIVARRLEAKASGDKAVANALKIIINSIYGLVRSQSSGAYLYGKTIGLDVCIAGELLLYTLAKEIQEVGGGLIQTNTDKQILSV